VIYLCSLLYVVAIYLRPAEIWTDFPFVEALAVLSVMIAGLSYLGQPRRILDLPHDKFVVGLWVAIVVSNLSWGWFGGAWFGFVEFFKVTFYYFLIRFAVRETWQVQGLIITVVAVNVVLAVSGIIQFHTGTGLGGQPLLFDGRIRGTGIFNDPNDLAMSLVMIAPFLLDVAGDGARSFSRRVIASGALAAVLLAIFYTNSRSGVVSLGVVVAAYSFARLGNFAGAIAALVLFAAALSLGPSRMSMLDPAEESAQMRIQAWSSALVMLKGDPLFGVGFARFTDFHERTAHSSFVHVFGELGLFGAFFWVGIYYWLVKGVLPSPTCDDVDLGVGRWRFVLLLSTIGVLASSCFLSRQYILYPYTLVALGACYTAIANQQGADIDMTISARSLTQIIAIAVGGVLMIYLTVRLFAQWAGL